MPPEVIRFTFNSKKEPLALALVRAASNPDASPELAKWRRHKFDPGKDGEALMNYELFDPTRKELPLVFTNERNVPERIEFMPGTKVRQAYALMQAYRFRKELDEEGLMALNQALFDNPGGIDAIKDPDKKKAAIEEAGTRLREAVRVTNGAAKGIEFQDQIDDLKKKLPSIATPVTPSSPMVSPKVGEVVPGGKGAGEPPLSYAPEIRAIDKWTETLLVVAQNDSPMARAKMRLAEDDLVVALGGSMPVSDKVMLPAGRAQGDMAEFAKKVFARF